MAYNLLKGKRGIIFGALNEQSIAWKVAERAHEEGATFVLTNAPIAMRMGEINKLAEATGSTVIPADATSVEDIDNLITQSMEILGGKIDFVLHSIGMSINVRKGRHYTDENYDFTMKGLDVSALSFHKVMQVLYQKDAMNKWGSIVALTYMAAQRVFPDYNDMADNKSFLESIARSFGYHFGKRNNVPSFEKPINKTKNLLILLNKDSTKGTLVIRIAKVNCKKIPERTNLQLIFLLSDENKYAIIIMNINKIKSEYI